MRTRQTAAVSDWLVSVADVLPLAHRAVAPYTLGEAVAEFGAYARGIDAHSWRKSRPVLNYRNSLGREIEAQSERLGNQLSSFLAPLIDDVRRAADGNGVVAAASQFRKVWHSRAATSQAFRDLCDAAKCPETTSSALRELSAILASQVGPAAHDAFSPLRDASDALVSTEEELRWRRSMPVPGTLSEARRLEMAEESLLFPPAGRIVVWIVYARATLWGMRAAAGPITFLRPEWALPNAFESDHQDFPERTELRELRSHVHWLDDLHHESLKPESRLVLARVDLGKRQVSGAVEEARRRIDAVVSIAVQAGGVSWQSAGATAVAVDGRVHTLSPGLAPRGPLKDDDSYGMGATAEVLTSVADQLDTALSKGPMPDRLVEALTSLREARMTDHRDALFYGARRVTPRIATALEDHAIELIASELGVRPERLADALQRREALDHADQYVLSSLMSPLDTAWTHGDRDGRRELEQEITHYDGGRIVSIAKAVALQDEICSLTMTPLQRADLETALAICTDPARERQLLEDSWAHTTLLRERHRRVRNAVNHGLPLGAIMLNSVRAYAAETSHAALNIALTWFKNGESGGVLLKREEEAWGERMARIDNGDSWAVEDARINDASE